MSISGQKQILAVLHGVRFLCVLADDDGAVEYAFRIPGEHAFVQLAARCVRPHVLDARMVIHKPLSIRGEEPIQRAVRAFTIKRDIQIVANQPAAK